MENVSNTYQCNGFNGEGRHQVVNVQQPNTRIGWCPVHGISLRELVTSGQTTKADLVVARGEPQVLGE